MNALPCFAPGGVRVRTTSTALGVGQFIAKAEPPKRIAGRQRSLFDGDANQRPQYRLADRRRQHRFGDGTAGNGDTPLDHHQHRIGAFGPGLIGEVVDRRAPSVTR
ncbi:MAG: hypothetical protein B7Y43_07120 [Sphingomonas sp. 28-62-20]|uniref:hypothetical protein n=1 Tax=Sphingomonas sp. 28-62-20 TaxID=1970433 RepID=UPI000BD9F7EE|nr:MAG: hypothetical protein B7Y43_07120 [Sphingomonas sp. 28-62-20]